MGCGPAKLYKNETSKEKDWTEVGNEKEKLGRPVSSWATGQEEKKKSYQDNRNKPPLQPVPGLRGNNNGRRQSEPAPPEDDIHVQLQHLLHEREREIEALRTQIAAADDVGTQQHNGSEGVAAPPSTPTQTLPPIEPSSPIDPSATTETELVNATERSLVEGCVLRYLTTPNNTPSTVQVAITKVMAINNALLSERYNSRRSALQQPSLIQKRCFGPSSVVESFAQIGPWIPHTSGPYGAGVYFPDSFPVGGAEECTFDVLVCNVAVGNVWRYESPPTNLLLQDIEANGYDSVYAPQLEIPSQIIYNPYQAEVAYRVTVAVFFTSSRPPLPQRPGSASPTTSPNRPLPPPIPITAALGSGASSNGGVQESSPTRATQPPPPPPSATSTNSSSNVNVQQSAARTSTNNRPRNHSNINDDPNSPIYPPSSSNLRQNNAGNRAGAGSLSSPSSPSLSPNTNNRNNTRHSPQRQQSNTTTTTTTTTTQSATGTTNQPSASQVVQDSLEELAQEATCPICTELLLEAVTLECSHTFCSDCLATWINTQQQTCPVCRTRVKSKKAVRSRGLDNIVEKLLERKEDKEELRQERAQRLRTLREKEQQEARDEERARAQQRARDEEEQRERANRILEAQMLRSAFSSPTPVQQAQFRAGSALSNASNAHALDMMLLEDHLRALDMPSTSYMFQPPTATSSAAASAAAHYPTQSSHHMGTTTTSSSLAGQPTQTTTTTNHSHYGFRPPYGHASDAHSLPPSQPGSRPGSSLFTHPPLTTTPDPTTGATSTATTSTTSRMDPVPLPSAGGGMTYGFNSGAANGPLLPLMTVEPLGFGSNGYHHQLPPSSGTSTSLNSGGSGGSHSGATGRVSDSPPAQHWAHFELSQPSALHHHSTMTASATSGLVNPLPAAQRRQVPRPRLSYLPATTMGSNPLQRTTRVPAYQYTSAHAAAAAASVPGSAIAFLGRAPPPDPDPDDRFVQT